VADNSAGAPSLDTQNGGFTVFGQAVGSASLNTIRAIAAVPTRTFAAPFDTIPLRNFTGTALSQAGANNYVTFSDISVVAQPLTFAVASNSNTNLVTATITNNQLRLQYAANQTGTATISIRATDPDGTSVVDTFQVTVNP
jgi:hypothetical protein